MPEKEHTEEGLILSWWQVSVSPLLSPSKKLGHFVQIGELLVVADGRVTPL